MNAAAEDDAPPPEPSPRILVVEDDADFRELIAEVLHQLGEHAIAFAETGEDGLKRLREGAFDLLVTDLGLPGISGLSMLDEAERGGILGEAATIVCSGNAPLVEEMLRRRGVCCVPKPLDVDQLSEAVRARLPRESGVHDQKAESPRAPRPISGRACVEALMRAGFETIQRSVGFTILQRTVGTETRTVLVPEFFVLSPEIVDIVLRTVGLSPSTLTKLLAADEHPPDSYERPSQAALRSAERAREPR